MDKQVLNTSISRSVATSPVKRILFLRIPPFFGYILHHPHDVTLPFTIGYAATALEQQAYEVAVVDVWANGWSLEKTLETILNYSPDMIFYDASTGVVPTMQHLQEKIKQKLNVISVVFGTVSTFFPEILFKPSGDTEHNVDIDANTDAISKERGKHFDMGLVGECEQTILDLVNSVNNGPRLSDIPGLFYCDSQTQQLVKTASRSYIKDLDKLPIINYGLFDLKQYRKYSFPIPVLNSVRWGHILSTRGCPYSCSFCSHDHRQSYGRLVRRHSAGRIADEFDVLVKEHGVNAISIEDDIFTVNRDYVFAVCDAIEKRHLKVSWVIQTRADVLDRTLIKRMKSAGCIGASLGIESGNDRVLQALNKEVSAKQIEETIEIAAQEGLMLRLMFMMGNPDETEDEIQDTFKLAMKAKAITVQMHYCTPYPGTDFFDPKIDSIEQLSDFSSYNSIYRNLSQVPDWRLQELRNKFYHQYYFSWKYFKLFCRQRLPWFLAQAKDEIPFLLRSLWFLIKPPRIETKRSANSQ